ncbi:MAG: hypothetical protein ACYTAO_17400 [Planctomycetota bacterium]
MTCFTADDIFEIAEAIERNASEFYRQRSERLSSEVPWIAGRTSARAESVQKGEGEL